MGKHSRNKDREYDKILRELRKVTAKSRKRRRSPSSSTSESDRSYKHKRYYDYECNVYEDNDDNRIKDYQGEPSGDIYEGYEDICPEFIEPEASPPMLSETEPARPARPPPPPSPPVLTETLPVPAEIQNDVTNADEIPAKTSDAETVPLLEPEILELLGEDPADVKKYGENLHKDIASRWTHILTNGLTKDTQLELVKCYLPPQNCPNMKVPILNLEIKAALLDSHVKKDQYSQSKQNQLASSLAAIGQVLNWALSSKDIVPQNIIRTLSDAGRLICDSHYRESLSRRFAVLSTLNKNVRDTIRNTRIDEHLFGSALSDHIRSSKAIIKTGSEMKSTAVRPAYRPTVATQRQQRGALNSRGAPPRVAAAAEQRQRPAPRHAPPPPPRDRRDRDAAPRGRRPTNYTRPPMKRRY